MQVNLNLPDYKEEGKDDAARIISNHVDEIAEALSKWSHGDRQEAFRIEDIHGGDTWVPEGHSLGGISIDCWHAAAILETVPTKYHENDRGQWMDDNPVDTARACATSTYEHYVGCLVSELVAKAVNLVTGPLNKRQARKIITNLNS